MTVAIGAVVENGVVLVSDEWASNDSEKWRMPGGSVFKVGPLGIAYCGSVRAGQILQEWLLDLDAKETENADCFIRLIARAWQSINASKDAWDGDLLAAWRGKLYHIDYEGGLSEHERYFAIGAGSQFAMGYLAGRWDVNKSWGESVFYCLPAAVQRASEHCAGVVGMHAHRILCEYKSE